jgi:hypothetical protein
MNELYYWDVDRGCWLDPGPTGFDVQEPPNGRLLYVGRLENKFIWEHLIDVYRMRSKM